MEDIISTLIWIGLALISVIASAVKSNAKKKQAAQRPPAPQVPRTITADSRELDPELGPLMELFDLPRPKPQQQEVEYESVENGPGVEDAGDKFDSEISEYELSGMNQEGTSSVIDTSDNAVKSFEEGQSDIQKMIARYEAIRKELGENEDDIARGEIVSVEAEESARLNYEKNRDYFDLRKAIIYSEILKRREY